MFRLCLPEAVSWWCAAVWKRQEIKEGEKKREVQKMGEEEREEN